jgi:hypothetical protein
MPVTLLDIATANAADAAVGLIDEAAKTHPELTKGDARTIKGLNYKTLVRTGNPTVAFRDANEGSAISKGIYENRLIETFILNPQWEADKAVADAHEDGGPAYVAMEGLGMLEAALQTLASQFYYGKGTGGDAKGHPGLLGIYDKTNMVVDAGGTTADVASSVWAVRFGPIDTQWVWGLGGQLELSEPTECRVEDDSGNPYTAYRQEILARPGLQVGRIKAVGRIKKLTTDSGKGLTDTLIDDLLALFPPGRPPNAIFMTRRSQKQLKTSRTATTPTGAAAKWPTSIEGPDGNDIPIHPTEAILDTEALTL